MSYTLIYKKQFVKVEDKILIMAEAGDNNVYDGKKRTRSWQNMTFPVNNYGLLMTPDEVNRAADFTLSMLQKQGAVVKENFGWYAGVSLNGKSTSATTFSDYKNFFKNGLAKALSLEEIREQGGSLEVREYTKEDFSLLSSYYPKTTQELKSRFVLSELNGTNCFFRLSPPWVPKKRIFRSMQPKKEGFVLTGQSYYLGRINKRRVSYGGLGIAQTYPSRKKAEDALVKVQLRFKNLFPVEIAPYPVKQAA